MRHWIFFFIKRKKEMNLNPLFSLIKESCSLAYKTNPTQNIVTFIIFFFFFSYFLGNQTEDTVWGNEYLGEGNYWRCRKWRTWRTQWAALWLRIVPLLVVVAVVGLVVIGLGDLGFGSLCLCLKGRVGTTRTGPWVQCRCSRFATFRWFESGS